MPDKKNTVLLLDPEYEVSLQILQGARQVANSHPAIRLLPISCLCDDVIYDLAAHNALENLIAPLVSDKWIEGFASKRVRLINISSFSKITLADSVVINQHSLGSFAADHLLSAGFRSFAILGNFLTYAAEQNRRGYDEFLRAENASCGATLFYSHNHPIDISALKNLPKPCGIFCTSDAFARPLAEQILAKNFSIPSDFGIISAGNAPAKLLTAPCQITSIRLPFVRLGEEAMKLALRREDKNPGDRPPHIEKILPAGLARRDSTMLENADDPIVKKAVSIMLNHLDSNITNIKLAQLCNISPRLLNYRFKAVTHMAPASYQKLIRLEKAKVLLRNTKQTLEEIASETGFCDAGHFASFFKKRLRITPGDYRNLQISEPSDERQ